MTIIKMVRWVPLVVMELLTLLEHLNLYRMCWDPYCSIFSLLRRSLFVMSFSFDTAAGGVTQHATLKPKHLATRTPQKRFNLES